MNLQIQTNGTGTTHYKAYTFDSLANLKNKIHQISDVPSKPIFSTTPTHFRIKKGINLSEKNHMNKVNDLAKPTQKETSSNLTDQIRPKTTQNNPQISVTNDSFKQVSKQEHHVRFEGSQPLRHSLNSSFNKNQKQQQQVNQIMSSTASSFQVNSPMNNNNNNIHNNTQEGQLNNEKGIWRIQSQKQFQQLMKSDIPSEKIHLKVLGFQNYKYPCPPKTGFQLLSKDSNKGRQLSQLQSNNYSRSHLNSIESVWASKVNSFAKLSQWQQHVFTEGSSNQNIGIADELVFDGSMPAQHENNNSNSNDQDINYPPVYQRLSSVKSEPKINTEKIRRHEINSNKFMFSLNKQNRDQNLEEVLLKAEDKRISSSSKHIFPRWKPQIEGQSRPVTSNQPNPRFNSENQAAALSVVFIDRIPLQDEITETTKALKDNDFFQKYLRALIDLLTDFHYILQMFKWYHQKMRSSMTIIRQNQQSNMKKLTSIIEKYNELIRKSSQVNVPSSQQNNYLRLDRQSMLSSGKRSSKNNQNHFSDSAMFFHLNNAGVMIESFEILKRNTSVITEKILGAFGLNMDLQFSEVSLEQIIAFYRILIHRDSAISETIKFLEKFFKGEQQELSKEDFKKTLRILTIPYADSKPAIFERIVQVFTNNFTIGEHSPVVDFKKFKQTFMSNSLNIYDMIDLICGRT